ncbi:MAG: hypothetical protein M0029_01975 [Actinomycetota bacterium]|nr:hypothetical protein [Actinomycetota bacterium]
MSVPRGSGAGPALDLGALAELVAASVSHRRAAAGDELAKVASEDVVVADAEVVRPGRPGLVSVTANVDALRVHVVLGLRAPGDEVRFLTDADDAPLGIIEDETGLAVVFDALGDAELADLLLDEVAGDQGPIEWVHRIAETSESVSLAYDDRLAFTVFQQLPAPGERHSGLELYLGLDDAGFNQLLAPVALWQRRGTDLGVVQEYQPGTTTGWVLALASLRDLAESGAAPEEAGADFAAEANRLGTMTARMHLALDTAFGRRTGDVSTWTDAVEASARAADPAIVEDASVQALLAELRRTTRPCVAIRTHGDFHLGRVARTDLGWLVLDCSPGGVPAGEGTAPTFRSPLADVADMLWSLHRAAEVAAAERDPTGEAGLRHLTQAWEVRNRRAYLAGYLATPGIGGLVPSGRDLVRTLAAAFELERSAIHAAARA